MSNIEAPYQGVNLQKTDTNMIKKLIDFSLDYDIQKPDPSIDQDGPSSPKLYSTMKERARNESRGSRADLLDEDLVQI